MTLILSESATAKTAYNLVLKLQDHLVARLEALCGNRNFEPVTWLRAQGKFGGGKRLVARDEAMFNRASVNTSQVQYDADPSKALGSASALSAIVHPRNPFAPSMHMHISWTEMKHGAGYWRIMADLNPSIPDEADRAEFAEALQRLAGEWFSRGVEQGNRYFYIPALNRSRGVAHFYLEQFKTADAKADLAFAENFGIGIIDRYASIVQGQLAKHKNYFEADREAQLAYHTLYFLQVLSLDRGTTSGLLVHDENDQGILGSLPARINRDLLNSWLGKLPDLQRVLMQGLLDVLPKDATIDIGDSEKLKLAAAARKFYRENPQAEELLARGDILPPTQANHGSK